jgi:hypothetical protein
MERLAVNLPPNRARWDRRWLELFEERAGIIEFMSNVSRETAEFRAEADVRRIAAREERTA